MIDQFVDKIFIINLNHRTDRWSLITSQLDRLNIKNYERFPAYIYKNDNISNYICGNVGCIISHYLINEVSRSCGYKKILILEDDCEFLEENYYNYNFKKSFMFLENCGYDMFYLGATFHKYDIEPINDYVDQINQCCATHAIITDVNIIYDRFKTRYDSVDGIINYSAKSDVDTSIFTIDGTYGSFNLRRFVTNPILAIQRPSHSDITGHFSATNQYNMWKEAKVI